MRWPLGMIGNCTTYLPHVSVVIFLLTIIARNASHFTAKRASSAFVTIERLSHKRSTATALIRAAAMICTGRPSQTRRFPRSSLLLLVDFFPFLSFLALAWWLVQMFYIWLSPHGLLSCFSLCACVNGWGVCELDDLLVVLLLVLLVYGETSS